MELFQGNEMWKNQARFNNFDSFQGLFDHVDDRASRSFSVVTDVRDLVVSPGENGELQISRQGKRGANMSHWTFSQLSKLTGSRPDFLRSLTPQTASIVLNERLGLLASRPNTELTGKLDLFYTANKEQTSATLRGINSVDYGRVYDKDYLSMIRDPILAGGWQLPLGYKGGRWGAEMVPTGAYSNDRMTFLFMVDYSRPIEFRGEQLFRGFFTWNTEVGGKSWAFMSFLFRSVCGNSIVWGAEGVNLMRIYHRGDYTLDRIAQATEGVLTEYVNTGTTREVQVIQAAMDKNVAKNDAEAVTFIRENDFTKGEAEAAVGAANKEEGGAGSLWNLVNGLTAHARTIPFVNERNELEIKAGKLLELVAA